MQPVCWSQWTLLPMLISLNWSPIPVLALIGLEVFVLLGAEKWQFPWVRSSARSTVSSASKSTGDFCHFSCVFLHAFECASVMIISPLLTNLYDIAQHSVCYSWQSNSNQHVRSYVTASLWFVDIWLANLYYIVLKSFVKGRLWMKLSWHLIAIFVDWLQSKLDSDCFETDTEKIAKEGSHLSLVFKLTVFVVETMGCNALYANLCMQGNSSYGFANHRL
jgi:hypothetical protein